MHKRISPHGDYDHMGESINNYEYLYNKYGAKIADGVLYLSENKKIENYIARKKDFINKIKNVDNNIILVEIVDKLQNLISDYDVYLEKGKNYLVTEANNFEELKWFFWNLRKYLMIEFYKMNY